MGLSVEFCHREENESQQCRRVNSLMSPQRQYYTPTLTHTHTLTYAHTYLGKLILR